MKLQGNSANVFVLSLVDFIEPFASVICDDDELLASRERNEPVDAI